MVAPYRPKPPRNRVAISTRDLARRMRKRLNKTTEGIEAAVAKVKKETAVKELEAKRTSWKKALQGFLQNAFTGRLIRFVKLGGSMKWRSARNGLRP